MGIRIDKDRAHRVLTRAHSMAADYAVEVPSHWIAITRQIGESPSRTFVAGFGAALLAKATDDGVDPLSIKSAYSERAFSLRTLCHSVLVPHSKEAIPTYHLGATGREPLNNQPYFRYDHLDAIERVSRSAYPYLAILKRELRRADGLDTAEACRALAAFIRERISVQIAVDEMRLVDVSRATSIAALRQVLTLFLAEEQSERPARLQATVIGLVACVSPEQPSMQRLNDPSRRVPGDVHVPALSPRFTAEVRGKPVPQHEAEDFVRACGSAGIGTAWIVALSDDHKAIDRDALLDIGLETCVLSAVFESIDELLVGLFAIPSLASGDVLDRVGPAVSDALRALETSTDTIREWTRLLDAHRDR